MQRQQLLIVSVLDQARMTRSFILRPQGHLPVTFTAGQVAVLQVKDEQGYFAFASAPGDPELEILVKQKVGASRLIFDMKEGEKVELLGIAGHGFPLDHYKNRDLVFVAMGTGVAPLRSALRHVLRRKEEFGQLVVLYGAQTPDDFCYRYEIDHWADEGVQLRQVISRPAGHDWSGPTGYVQSLLDHVLPNLTSPVALICGSREMIEETRETLVTLSFKQEEILTNY